MQHEATKADGSQSQILTYQLEENRGYTGLFARNSVLKRYTSGAPTVYHRYPSGTSTVPQRYPSGNMRYLFGISYYDYVCLLRFAQSLVVDVTQPSVRLYRSPLASLVLFHGQALYQCFIPRKNKAHPGPVGLNRRIRDGADEGFQFASPFLSNLK